METTIYTKHGKPVVYISEDHGNAIYTWNGHAISYIYEDRIYGWRGKHIGWFIGGIIYNLSGHRVGYTKEACPYAVYAPYTKYVKYAQYAKYARYLPYAKPSLSNIDSGEYLEEFLAQDSI